MYIGAAAANKLMVVLSSSFQQAVQFPPAGFNGYRYRQRRSINNGGLGIRCGIAEASGEPAPFGQKTKYNDGLFEKAFMTLFARKMEKFAAHTGNSHKKGWLEYDYESFVDVSKRVMQGRSRLQQQQVVREVLVSMLPPGAPAQVIFHFPRPSS